MGDIKIGNLSIDKMFVGSNEVVAVYYGNIKVWESTSYEYTFLNGELTITNAPYTQSGDELTIGE